MSISLQIKVVPSSGKQRMDQTKSGIPKCYLKSAPEKGKANNELIKLLSKWLKVPQKDINIIKGATTRNKTLMIDTEQTKEQIYEKLGIETQLSI